MSINNLGGAMKGLNRTPSERPFHPEASARQKKKQDCGLKKPKDEDLVFDHCWACLQSDQT